ncbi:hypothetical protein BDV98DRAFT_515346, partial [Pterulicium gracile]
EGIPVDQQYLFLAGKQLEDERRIQDHQTTADSALHFVFKMRGGKPVIHLFSPQEMDATVSLSLDSTEWKSTVRYPEPALSQGITHEEL